MDVLNQVRWLPDEATDHLFSLPQSLHPLALVVNLFLPLLSYRLGIGHAVCSQSCTRGMLRSARFVDARKIKMLRVRKRLYVTTTPANQCANSKKHVQQRRRLSTTPTQVSQSVVIPSADGFPFQTGFSVARSIERGSGVFCDHSIQAGCQCAPLSGLGLRCLKPRHPAHDGGRRHHARTPHCFPPLCSLTNPFGGNPL